VNSDELRAIRERNECKKHPVILSKDEQVVADIDALLAEIERLQNILPPESKIVEIF
jgi:hypothetical protein